MKNLNKEQVNQISTSDFREEREGNRMNGDLISRKALIENLNRFAPEHYSALVNDLIVKQPAAFDKEKVINTLMIMATISEERMKFYAEKGFTQNESLADGKARAYRSAMEIIEKGGIE